jgi:DNA-directed RNA polymerase alpha subunit
MESLGFFTDIKHHENEIEFILNNSESFIANAIRRTAISKIKLLAFYDEKIKDNDDQSNIKIIENTGALHNEFIRHRISMLPIYVNPEDLKNYKDYTFELKVESKGDTITNITTKDITGTLKDQSLTREELDSFFLSHNHKDDYILITKLRPKLNEKLHIVMKLTLGIGKNNATFSPVSKCIYINEIDTEAEKLKRQEIKNENEQKIFDCHDKYRIFKVNERNDPNTFRFSIETVGQLSPVFIVNKSLEVLKEEVFDLKHKENRSVSLSSNIEGQVAVDFKIQGICHTLGNLIQGFIYNSEFSSSSPQNLIYIGYNKPHPLDEHIVFRMVLKSSYETQKQYLHAAEKLFDNYLEDLAEKLDKLSKDFHEKNKQETPKKTGVKIAIKLK